MSRQDGHSSRRQTGGGFASSRLILGKYRSALDRRSERGRESVARQAGTRASSAPVPCVTQQWSSPARATTIDESRKERGHYWPVFLPDGRRFLNLVQSDDREQTGIYQGSIDSTQTHRLFAAGSNARPAGTYLLSLSNRALIAQVFDPDHAQVA